MPSSNDSARLALETLVILVSRPAGARVFSAVEDLSPLTEIAPSQPLVMDALSYAWLNDMAANIARPEYKRVLRSKIDSTIGSLVSSFKGTDAVTLLAFLSRLLPRLDPDVSSPTHHHRRRRTLTGNLGPPTESQLAASRWEIHP